MTTVEAEPIVAAWLRLDTEVDGFLRPITTEAQYTQTLSLVEALIDRVNKNAVPTLAALLEVLIDQVAAYEATIYTPTRSTVPHMLGFLMQNNGFTVSSIAQATGLPEGQVVDLLAGMGVDSLTVAQLRALSEHVRFPLASLL